MKVTFSKKDNYRSRKDGSGSDHHHHHHHKKKKNIGLRVALIVVAVLVVIAGSVVGVLAYKRAQGQKQIMAQQAMMTPAVNQKKDESGPSSSRTMNTDDIKEETQATADGSILYKGARYKYNTEITNYLIMGIDTAGEVPEEVQSGKGGQCDMLMLVVINKKDKTIKMININRNTMTKISIYDESNQFSHYQKEQIALSHSYGDGKEESADLTSQAVSNLLRNTPIHRYAALNIDGIPTINDWVGGVQLDLLDDFTSFDASYTKGSSQLLLGDMAKTYIQKRYGIGDETNENRMDRQKQYMMAFYSKLKSEFGSNLAGMAVKLPDLYKNLTPYLVTNITQDEMLYWGPEFLGGYAFDENSMISLKGDVKEGDVYAEFEVDEDSLYEMIINTFYEKVS